MRLPLPRGPLSETVVTALAGGGPVRAADRVEVGDDLHLALWVCSELGYRGFEGVDPAWEWDADLIALRTALERAWLAELRDRVPSTPVVEAADIPEALKKLVAEDTGPPLAKFLHREATLEQFREFVIHRSIYHIKEADPHTMAIPRIGGRAKAALVEIQVDEYGGGRLENMHSELFRRTMRGLGLDDSYGFYLNEVPGITLAVSNTGSLFARHGRWTGALLGHLAAFEMTSSLPNRRYGNGLRRLGFGGGETQFFDVHVEADAVHEQLAAYDLCGNFAADQPHRAEDMLFGAGCCLAVEAMFAEHVLENWGAGRSSLRHVLDEAA